MTTKKKGLFAAIAAGHQRRQADADRDVAWVRQNAHVFVAATTTKKPSKKKGW